MSLISPTVAASFSAEFEKFFDYFSRDFVVNKEPLKVLVSPATTPLFGYETQSTPAAYNYIPVQATFKGRISYNKKQSEDILTDVRVSIAIILFPLNSIDNTYYLNTFSLQRLLFY